MAASTALAGAACSRTPDHHIYPYVHMPEAGTSGLPVYYASAFVRDGYAHGVLIGTSEGRPTKIEGNRLHPSSRGATDIHAQASVLQLWDPDRAQSVRRRLANGTSPSTWQAFESDWNARIGAAARQRGDGVRILTGAFGSPTLHAQLASWLSRYPQAHWHRHAPLDQRTSNDATRLLYGRALAPVLHFDKAEFVLSIGADPFSQGPGAVRHAADWAALRASAEAAGRPLPTLVALETTPGLFGARADERHAMTPADMTDSLVIIAGALYGDLRDPTASTARTPNAWEARIITSLRQQPGRSLIVGGDTLTAAAHGLIALLNQRLGNLGRTVDLIEPVHDAADSGQPESLQALVDAMNAGAVDTLLLIGGNPVYDSPGSMRFAEALQRVPWSASFGLYEHETGTRTHWHLPETHAYEQWSDARAHDGTITIVQPAIAPLYDTRSVHELMALLQSDDVRDGHALIRRRWQATMQPNSQPISQPGTKATAQPDPATSSGGFDRFWAESLRRGVVAGSTSPPITVAAPDASAISALWSGFQKNSDKTGSQSTGDELVAIFPPDAAAGDGSMANNAWLHELPRAFTRHTWGNAALIGRKTASRLQVDTGDIVRFSVGDRFVEAPVWVLAGQAEGAVTLPLGLGRTHAGRVGDGIGFDAYRLRPGAAAEGTIRIKASRTGSSSPFAVTQHELDEHGRELARTMTMGHQLNEPKPRPRAKTQRSGPPTPDEMPSLYPPKPAQPHAWAMVIDLDACIGCNACTIACQAENNIPVVGAEQVAKGRSMHWIRVDNYDDVSEHQQHANAHDDNNASNATLFQPVPCMHCENAPCEVVCPVAATVHDTDGLNVQVYNRCIGTRFCSNNCPYKVRRFNFLQYSDEQTESLKLQRNPDVTVRQRGVMEKCTYCVQRISHARLSSEKAGKPLVDGDVVTACQSVCPTRAIHFGDRNDPDSDVVKAARSPRHYTMLDELNTRPRTTYLARLRAEDALPEPKGSKA